MQKALDEWIEDAVDRSLFSGDPLALDDLKKARGIWKEYLSMTRPQVGDDAGRRIQSIIRNDVGPMEVTNWLLGANKIGAGGLPRRMVQRIKTMFGADSDEIKTLRQAMWLRLTMAPEGADMPGPKLVSNRLSQFLTQDLADALYTPRQREAIRHFQSVLRRTVLDPPAGNPPKSGYKVARALADGWSNTMMVLGFVGGGIETAVVARMGIPLIRGGINAARALQATRKPVPLVPTVPPGGGGAYSGTLAEQLRQQQEQITVQR